MHFFLLLLLDGSVNCVLYFMCLIKNRYSIINSLSLFLCSFHPSLSLYLPFYYIFFVCLSMSLSFLPFSLSVCLFLPQSLPHPPSPPPTTHPQHPHPPSTPSPALQKENSTGPPGGATTGYQGLASGASSTGAGGSAATARDSLRSTSRRRPWSSIIRSAAWSSLPIRYGWKGVRGGWGGGKGGGE